MDFRGYTKLIIKLIVTVFNRREKYRFVCIEFINPKLILKGRDIV